MPTNPFGGIGSRDITEQTGAIRAYEQARKRLIATMKGEERAATSLQAIQAKSGAARARDAVSHEKELTRASLLLGAQGVALKKLDVTREKYHREEMDRSKSLLQRYEDIKQALKEIQEDSDDTSTILGTFVKPMKTGIDQMLKLGTLPRVTRPIREVGASLDDVGGSLTRAGGAASDLGHDMVDVLPAVSRYRVAIEQLNIGIAALKTRYVDAGEGTEKLAYQFISLSKTDIGLDGSVEKVVAVTDSLKRLEGQGVDTGTALETLVERSRTTGRTFTESAQDLEAVSAQADILRKSLEESNSVLQGFAFTVRDDFVRAIADATRNLDSQVTSVGNVAAAYAYATEQATKYGLSSKSTEKIAGALTQSLFKERQDAVAMLSGQDLAADINKAMKDARKALGEGASEADIEAAAYEQFTHGKKLTAEARGTFHHAAVSAAEGGLGNVDVRNLLAGTTEAIRADINAQMNHLGIKNIDSDSVSYRLLASLNGWQDLSTDQQMTLNDILKTQGPDALADRMAEMQREAEQRASSTQDQTTSALSAVLSMKDPIQLLPNMKDYLKAITLNISNVVKILESTYSFLTGSMGTISGLFADTTQQAVDSDSSQEARRSLSEIPSLQKGIIDQIQELGHSKEGETDSERETRLRKIQDLVQQNSEQSLRQGEIARQQAERDIISQHISESASPSPEVTPAPPVPGSGVLETLGGFLGSMFGGEEPTGESGRDAGLSMARRTSTSTSRSPVPAPTPSSPSRSTGSTPSELEASGTGSITVSPSGESILTVRMRIQNMGEVIAYHNTQEARQLDQFGLGG